MCTCPHPLLKAGNLSDSFIGRHLFPRSPRCWRYQAPGRHCGVSGHGFSTRSVIWYAHSAQPADVIRLTGCLLAPASRQDSPTRVALGAYHRFCCSVWDGPSGVPRSLSRESGLALVLSDIFNSIPYLVRKRVHFYFALSLHDCRSWAQR